MISILLQCVLAATNPSPLNVVKHADAEVQKVLKESPSVERLAKTADAYVDFLELAKRALGKEWDKLNRKQQEDFGATMKGLLRASYAQKAISDGKGGGAKIEYGDEKIEGNEAAVKTQFLVKTDKFPVEYRLYRVDAKGPWRIYDVITDEVSLVSTYNDQFRQVISKKGFDGLLASLKAKKAQLEKKSDEPKSEGAASGAGAEAVKN